jgi:hypothetical protein
MSACRYGLAAYQKSLFFLTAGGLLDISTARYFYKVPKTILHKPTANSGINIFYNNVYTNIIYNIYNISYSVKQTVFQKQELFFEKAAYL